MKRNLMMLVPVVIASLAVGFIVLRGQSIAAEDMSITTATSVADFSDEQPASRIPGDIIFSAKIDSVVFSHKKHAVDLGFECNTCHTNIFQMKAGTAEAQSDFNMEGLGAGHYCGSCHAEESVAFDSGSQCARCHQGVKGLEAPGQAENI